jgi:hypothetical protein
MAAYHGDFGGEFVDWWLALHEQQARAKDRIAGVRRDLADLDALLFTRASGIPS